MELQNSYFWDRLYFPWFYFPMGLKSFSAMGHPSGILSADFPFLFLVKPQMERQCTFRLASQSRGYVRSSLASGAGSSRPNAFSRSEYVQL